MTVYWRITAGLQGTSDVANRPARLIRWRGMQRTRRGKARLLVVMAFIWSWAATLVSGPGYAQESRDFNLMCSTPIFPATRGENVDPTFDEQRCYSLRNRFNEYLRSQGFNDFFVQFQMVEQDGAIDMIVSRSMEKSPGVDVWVGGARFLHEIALEKQLVAETAEISRSEWRGNTLNVSITRSTKYYKLAYMFTNWIRESEDIPGLTNIGG